jgi:hypothetical protein
MSKLHRGPSIDVFYQVSVHLAKRFQRRRFFRNQPIRNKNCLWRPCLLTDRDEMSNLDRGPSIDASYQVLVHLAKRFRRRRFLKFGQSETRIACRSFLPSFSLFGREVSEEKITLWKINRRLTTDVKWWQKLTLPLTRWANNKGNVFVLYWVFYEELWVRGVDPHLYHIQNHKNHCYKTKLKRRCTNSFYA